METATETTATVSDATTETVTDLDTPEIKAELQKAIDLAGDDESLIKTQRQQCKTEDTGGSSDPIEPFQLFDNLYFVGNANVGVFIFTTTEGYIMIDSGYDYRVEETIIPGMKELGLDPAQVKYILITHAGPDHAGQRSGHYIWSGNIDRRAPEYSKYLLRGNHDWARRRLRNSFRVTLSASPSGVIRA